MMTAVNLKTYHSRLAMDKFPTSSTLYSATPAAATSCVHASPSDADGLTRLPKAKTGLGYNEVVDHAY